MTLKCPRIHSVFQHILFLSFIMFEIFFLCLGPYLSDEFQLYWNKANLRDLIAAAGLEILLKLDSNWRFLSLCDLEIWWMTSKNYRASLLHYIKLCASSQTPRWIQTEVTVREHSIRVKIGDFLSHVTLKFDGWPWNTIGHLFFAMLNFVHHFKAIGEFKLELQSGNAEFGSKSAIFLSHATLKFDAWPWKIIGHLSHIASSFVHHFTAIGEFKLKLQSGNAQFGSKSAFIVPCDREIWRMTFKNNRTHILCRFKLYASFRSYRWIRTKVIVRKRLIFGQNRWCWWNSTDGL